MLKKTALFVLLLTVIVALAGFIFLHNKKSRSSAETDRKMVSRGKTTESDDTARNFPASLQRGDGHTDHEPDTDNLEEFFRKRKQQKQLLSWLQSYTDEVYEELAYSVYSDLVQKEKPDQAWTQGVSITLESLLSSDEFSGSTIDKVQCGSAICEARLHHENRKALAAFWGRKSNGQMPWDTESYSNFERGEAGAFFTNMFFSRTPADLTFHIRAREEMLKTVESRGKSPQSSLE